MRLPAIVACLAAVLAPASASGSAAEWSTTYGRLTLPALTGTYPIYAPYPDGGGRLKGEMRMVEDTPVIIGHWIQHSAAQACDTRVDGSRYWGNVTLYFDKEFKRFTGGWDYCGEGIIFGDWDGRMGGPVKAPKGR